MVILNNLFKICQNNLHDLDFKEQFSDIGSAPQSISSLMFFIKVKLKIFFVSPPATQVN